MSESRRKPLLCGPAAQHCTFKLDIQEAERDLGCLEVYLQPCIFVCMLDMIVIYYAAHNLKISNVHKSYSVL